MNNKGFKAYDSDLTCRGFKYEVGKEYEEETAELCKSGFHFCENPLDTLNYYDLIDDNCKIARFTKIEALDEIINDGDKSVTKKIKIGAELEIEGFIRASFDFLWEKTNKNARKDTFINQVAASKLGAQIAKRRDYSRVVTNGDYSQIATSGDYGLVGVGGNYSRVVTNGNYSQTATSGDYSQVVTNGRKSQTAASGNCVQVAASGNCVQVATSGHCVQVATSGNYGRIATSGVGTKVATSGNETKVTLDGKYSVGCAIGVHSRIKGTKGSWITLAEYEWNDEKCIYVCTCVKSAQIDGEILKESTWYALQNGEFVEC